MSEKKMLEAGKIVNTHGINGEIKIEPWCDSARFLQNFDIFYIDGGEFNVTSSREHKNMLLAKLEGVDSVEDAQKLKQKIITIDCSEVTLPDGRYFVQDLIGLHVLEENGEFFGNVFDVLTMPAHDVYHVKSEGGDHYIPAVPEFIKSIDLEKQQIIVKLIEGM